MLCQQALPAATAGGALRPPQLAPAWGTPEVRRLLPIPHTPPGPGPTRDAGAVWADPIGGSASTELPTLETPEVGRRGLLSLETRWLWSPEVLHERHRAKLPSRVGGSNPQAPPLPVWGHKEPAEGSGSSAPSQEAYQPGPALGLEERPPPAPGLPGGSGKRLGVRAWRTQDRACSQRSGASGSWGAGTQPWVTSRPPSDRGPGREAPESGAFGPRVAGQDRSPAQAAGRAVSFLTVRQSPDDRGTGPRG